MVTLKKQLNDWTDIDWAARYLAHALGIIDIQESYEDWLFWSDNPIGNMLVEHLDQMVNIGLLLKRDRPDFQYKWNEDFVIGKNLYDNKQ